MKTRTLRTKAGGGQARSVLECGSPLPLSKGNARTAAAQSAGGPAHSKTWRILGALLAVFALIGPVHAQSYSIDWYKIAGGGGTSTNSQYSVTGTIGQPDASANNAMSGGNYTLTGGFWSLYAVQTTGAPLLTISYAANQAVVSWSPSATGWTLQTNANLATGAWGNYIGAVVNNNATNSPPRGNLFFRLSHP
jgi:hypothetical protein